MIAPDLRGFGGSQVVAGTASMEQMADDLDALLDALAIDEPVVICGLSMGGYVAFQFWRKYSSRLRGLVLCDTRAVADTPEAAAGAAQAGRNRARRRHRTAGRGDAAQAVRARDDREPRAACRVAAAKEHSGRFAPREWPRRFAGWRRGRT